MARTPLRGCCRIRPTGIISCCRGTTSSSPVRPQVILKQQPGTTIPREVATVDAVGTINTTTALTNYASATVNSTGILVTPGVPTSVTSTNGTSFYLGGTGAGAAAACSLRPGATGEPAGDSHCLDERVDPRADQRQHGGDLQQPVVCLVEYAGTSYNSSPASKRWGRDCRRAAAQTITPLTARARRARMRPVSSSPGSNPGAGPRIRSTSPTPRWGSPSTRWWAAPGYRTGPSAVPPTRIAA